MNILRKKTTATLLIAIFMISGLSLIVFVKASIILELDDPSLANSAVPDSNGYIGSGSWASAGDKFGLWLTPSYLFGSDFTIDDIEVIEYHTYKPTVQGGLNFYINIYTQPYTGGSSSWYGSRLTCEPMYSNNFVDTVGSWNKWSTDPGQNQLTIFDQPRSLAYGWYYPPTLSNLQASAINWNNWLSTAPITNIDYGPETVKYIVIDTGSAWASTFQGSVDALTIILTDGSSVTVDLEPPPIIIDIDIKPGSDPNSINLKSKGVVPVAVLTTEDFDASDVEPETVLFAETSPVRWTTCDVDNDGDLDMLFHFKTQELNLDADSIEATLVGESTGGSIEGTDTVNIVPKGK